MNRLEGFTYYSSAHHYLYWIEVTEVSDLSLCIITCQCFFNKSWWQGLNHGPVAKHHLYHRRRKYGGSSPYSLWPISYFGSIWELYVLDPKTNVFCRKKDPATLSHEQGTHSAKIVPIVWLEIAKMPPQISAQFVCPSPKVSNFWKKALSGCP